MKTQCQWKHNSKKYWKMSFCPHISYNYYPCTILLTNVNPIGKIVYYALSFMYWIPKAKAHLTYLCALIGTSDFPKLTHNTKQVYVDYIDEHEEAYLWDIDINPRLHEFVILS